MRVLYERSQKDKMAGLNTARDERNEFDVRVENKNLVDDIVRYCSQGDYKKHKVLLAGQSGVGKSSVINTLLKVIIGEYIPRAKAGCGDVTSFTLQLKCYKNCGAKDSDFERQDMKSQHRRHRGLTMTETFWSVRENLPDIFDAAGMKDKNDENTKEILRLLIGGFILPNTNLAELTNLQETHGLGYLPLRYSKARDENKMTMVVFACSCVAPVPENLIRCVREVLQEVDSFTSANKYETDIFVLITKYDKVETDVPVTFTADRQDEDSEDSIELIGATTNTDQSTNNSPEEDDNAENETRQTLTLKAFKAKRKQIATAFIHTGHAEQNQMNWTSYNDDLGYDNVYVDNIALKLLKVMAKPHHTDDVPVNNDPVDLINRVLVDLLFFLRRLLGQNVQLNISHVLLFFVVIAFILGLIMYTISGTVHRY